MVDIQKGGAFLVEEAGTRSSFIPEHLSIEQRELTKTVHEFVVNEVLPQEEFIEEMQPGLMPKLLKEAAKIGIFCAEIPAEYGGLDLGKVDSAAIAEGSTLQGSFNVAYMAHTGIGTSPLIYYGTEAQKKKYLEKLGTAELISSFALTEPEAGSDAMAIKTTAKLSADKKYYLLNGQKQFITNGGFANFFTVFAKTEKGGITAFLVEKAFGGITIGKEEKKMGIKGSSTVSLTFDDVKVPVENLLGEDGKGHHIAFNILNLGRLKLGAACVGVSKHLINLSYNYDSDRNQFGRPLTSFQIIEEKLAMMVSRCLFLESLVYRAVGLFDENMKGAKGTADIMDALREYAIEAAISKVYGSETLFQIADEAVQLHGGYGYCEEYGIERYFRDSRINRIYEGTNEINRLVITGTLLKMAVKGSLDIFSVLAEAPAKLKELLTKQYSNDEERVYGLVEVLKRLTLLVGAAAVQKYGEKIGDEQYVLGDMADMITECYAVESAYLRALELKKDGNTAKANAVISATLLYLLNTGATTFDKGRRIMMRVMPADSKELASYTKAVLGGISLIQGDQQKLALLIMDEMGRAGGYPF